MIKNLSEREEGGGTDVDLSGYKRDISENLWRPLSKKGLTHTHTHHMGYLINSLERVLRAAAVVVVVSARGARVEARVSKDGRSGRGLIDFIKW